MYASSLSCLLNITYIRLSAGPDVEMYVYILDSYTDERIYFNSAVQALDDQLPIEELELAIDIVNGGAPHAIPQPLPLLGAFPGQQHHVNNFIK